jgi:preprotein translocase subunit SecG
MLIVITIIHVIVSLFLIIVVLLQSGQAGDLAAAFGGQGSQAAFGARGASTILTKTTTWCAVIFMLTALTLSITTTRRGGTRSVLQNERSAPAQTTPVKPATPQPQK